jgi:hypothetical protein
LRARALPAASLAACALLLTGGPVRAQPSPLSLLPASGEVKGWTLAAAPKVYSGSGLFDYMDGAGEIPRSYGFRQLASGRYRSGATTIEAVVFDMGTPAEAFGYYSARAFLEHGPGASDRIVPLDHPAHLYAAVGVLTFWKDRFTVILQPEAGKPPVDALLQFARDIGGKIRAKGSPPALLGRLPRAHRAPYSERYVKGKAAFDSTILFSPHDVFGAASGAEAAAAEYNLAGATPTLFVVRYRSGQAAAALARYRAFLLSRKAVITSTVVANGFAAMAKREKGTAAAARGDSLAVVVGAADANAAASALKLLRTPPRTH